MKILFLNPLLDAEHNLIQALRRNGHSVLVAVDPLQAWQVLRFHGKSVDLAIVHREDAKGDGAPGLEFVTTAKEDTLQRTLPVILTTSKWKEEECVRHQSTPQGANAYLRFPLNEETLIKTISQVFGQALPSSTVAHLDELPMPDPEKSGITVAFPDASKMTVMQQPSGPFSGGAQSRAEAPTRVAAPSEDPTRMKPAGTSAASPAAGAPAAEASPAAEAPKAAAGAPASEGSELILEDAAALFETNESGGTGLIKLEAPELPPEEAAAAADGDAGAQAASGADPDATKATVVRTFVPDLEADPELEALLEKTSLKIRKQSDPLFPAPDPEMDAEINKEMPYLKDAETRVLGGVGRGLDGSEGEGESGAGGDAGYSDDGGGYETYAVPVGDAVVPGGAASSPDVDTLKKYLLLREQDVAALSTQLKATRAQLGRCEDALRKERGKLAETSHELEGARKKIAEFEREKQIALEGLQREIDEIRFTAKAKSDKVKLLEIQVREAAEEMLRLKDRVRADIRKIRVREKELENRLEIIKRDSEVLIAARENKIIELKRKLDLVEFNMDLLQDQHAREKENSAGLREKLNRALQAVRVAGGLLDLDEAAAALEGQAKAAEAPAAAAPAKGGKSRAAS